MHNTASDRWFSTRPLLCFWDSSAQMLGMLRCRLQWEHPQLLLLTAMLGNSMALQRASSSGVEYLILCGLTLVMFVMVYLFCAQTGLVYSALHVKLHKQTHRNLFVYICNRPRQHHNVTIGHKESEECHNVMLLPHPTNIYK
jgi:hypothetical protein